MNSWIKKQKSLLTLTSSPSSEAISIDENSRFTGYVNDDAALDSFKNHWAQARSIMQTKTETVSNSSFNNLEQIDGDHSITSDDVTTVINHIQQIISLLIQENQKLKILNSNNESTPIMMSPLLDYLLMESVLDKIFNWSSNIGEYTNAMKLEQLKLYEVLVSQLCNESMLFQTALIRPLLHLLSTCKDCAPLEVEKRLVVLLKTLCIFLSQNTDLLELFFVSDKSKNNIACTMDEVKSSPQLKNKLSYLDNPESRFLIFSLLISFVHREGSIGQQARESLLLIMSLSKTHPSIGIYISENSNFCPVLATGLSGLYSLLPRKLLTEVMSANDWHQLTNEDINEIVELQTFLNSLEFCNAVIKVSHPLVKQHLLEYISQGFLISVIGPALHQDIMQFPIEVLETYPKFKNTTIEEIIATTAYLELCLRTVTQPDLLEVFLKFIFTEKFDGQRILDTLTSRIACYKKLSLVTIVLFKTLLDLNCEDVMTELVFKYLLRLDFLSEHTHQQVERILDSSRLDQSARKLLNFIPINAKVQKQDSKPNKNVLEKLDSLNFDSDLMMSTNDDSFCSFLSCDYLMQNYVDYLNDAHQTIRNCIRGSVNWSRHSEYQLKEIKNRLVQQSNEKENQLNNTNKANCNNCLNNMTSDLPCEEHYFDKNNNQEIQFIGSFLSCLFNKLENFLNNDIYTNLQLTGLISRLVAYPQPILRSFFFNDSLHINQRVRTIWKILPKLKYRLEKQLEKIDNYDELIGSAKEYFESREKILLNEDKTCKGDRSPSLQSEKIIINIEPSSTKKKTIRDFWNRLRNDRSSTIVQKQQEIEYVNIKRNPIPNKPGCFMKNLSENQSIVLSVLIFSEFIKELSAICHELYILENEFNETNKIF